MRGPLQGVLCFAHLRWNFVYQRPQHVMSRLGRRRDVIYYEEPQRCDGRPFVATRREGNVTVAVPHLPDGMSSAQSVDAQRELLDGFLRERTAETPLLWYWTPMALEISRHLRGVRVYDCMDELSLFKDAPPQLGALERELLAGASLVLTGGRSLYYAKRRLHDNVHCFPSAVDAAHFAPAGRGEPAALSEIRRPRAGFYGVIDERFDCEFVRALAAELADWQLVFAGPVVKIDPSVLPQAPNIHYIGMRGYAELPALLEHWDVALLPFALNDATRFISPTKTLEYLAARRPVISTPIADVVDPYGEAGLVTIASTPAQAARAARRALTNTAPADWHRAIDGLLARRSWDATVVAMERRLDALGNGIFEAAG